MMRFFVSHLPVSYDPPHLHDDAIDILSKTLAYACDAMCSGIDYSKIKIGHKKLLMATLSDALLHSVDTNVYENLSREEKKELHSKIAYTLYKKALRFKSERWVRGLEEYYYEEMLGISFGDNDRGRYQSDLKNKDILAKFPRDLFMNENLLEAIITDVIAEEHQHILNSGSIFNFQNI